MPQVGFILADGRKAEFEECLNGAADTGVPAPLIASIISKLSTDPHRGRMLSVTSLIGCLRSVYLERTRDYYSPIIMNWYPHRGTVMHKALEARVEGWISEVTVERAFGGRTVRGRLDAYDSSAQILYDWKTVSASRLSWIRVYGPPREHILQINAYRLMMSADRPVRDMKLVYLGMNEIGITGLGEPPWPDGIIGLPAVAHLPDDEVSGVMERGAAILDRAFTSGEMPPVADAETRRWKCRRFCAVREYCEAVGDNPEFMAPVWSGNHAWSGVAPAIADDTLRGPSSITNAAVPPITPWHIPSPPRVPQA